MNSIGGHELALTIINDGEGYKKRVEIARLLRNTGNYPAADVRHGAAQWLNVAVVGARKYEKDFGSPGASCFTVVDILAAAVELAEYYDNHAAEMDRAGA